MQASAEKIWGAAQEHLRSMLTADTYNLWFAPLKACSMDATHLVLEVANDFCEVWLKDNYMGLLQDVVALAAGRQRHHILQQPHVIVLQPDLAEIICHLQH